HAFYNKSIGLTLSDDPMFKQWLKSTTVNRNSQADNFNLKHNFYQYTILAEKDTGIFNDEFLQICFDYFFRTVKTFQPKKLDAYQDLAEKVKQYNEEVKQRKLLYDREYDFLT